MSNGRVSHEEMVFRNGFFFPSPSSSSWQGAIFFRDFSELRQFQAMSLSETPLENLANVPMREITDKIRRMSNGRVSPEGKVCALIRLN